MADNRGRKRIEMKAAEKDSENKENGDAVRSESLGSAAVFMPHSAVYIRNRKTGEWEVRNPASSYAYNYISRNEFPDD